MRLFDFAESEIIAIREVVALRNQLPDSTDIFSQFLLNIFSFIKERLSVDSLLLLSHRYILLHALIYFKRNEVNGLEFKDVCSINITHQCHFLSEHQKDSAHDSDDPQKYAVIATLSNLLLFDLFILTDLVYFARSLFKNQSLSNVGLLVLAFQDEPLLIDSESDGLNILFYPSLLHYISLYYTLSHQSIH